MAEHFSDRVKNFFTINEPQCIVGLGYQTGEHAPGLKVGPSDYFRIWHNVLKAHGRAVEALREFSKQPVKISMAPCGALYVPETNKPEDIEAARKANFSLPENSIGACSWDVALCCDPVYLGQYPEDILKEFGQFFPKVTDADMKLISQPLDFFGQNIYNAVTVRAGEDGKAVRAARYDGFPQTAIGWPVTPEVLYWAPKFMQERYKKPFMITENGMASHDWVGVDGKVHDQARVDFMARYLGAYKRAAEDGVDLAGYFAWSVMDNFEWVYGYSQRFGLVYTDYNTQKRIWKDSAYFYKNIIETNGENL